MVFVWKFLLEISKMSPSAYNILGKIFIYLFISFEFNSILKNCQPELFTNYMYIQSWHFYNKEEFLLHFVWKCAYSYPLTLFSSFYKRTFAFCFSFNFLFRDPKKSRRKSRSSSKLSSSFRTQTQKYGSVETASPATELNTPIANTELSDSCSSLEVSRNWSFWAVWSHNVTATIEDGQTWSYRNELALYPIGLTNHQNAMRWIYYFADLSFIS